MAKDTKSLDKKFVNDLNKKYEEYKKKTGKSGKDIAPPSEPEPVMPEPEDKMEIVVQKKPKKKFGFFKKKVKKSVEPSKLFVEAEVPDEKVVKEDVKPEPTSEVKIEEKIPEEKVEEKLPEKKIEKPVEAKKEKKPLFSAFKPKEKEKKPLEKEEEPKKEVPKEEKKEVKPKEDKKILKPADKEKKHGFLGLGKKHVKEDSKQVPVDEIDYAAYYRIHKKTKKKRTPRRHLLETYLEKAGLEEVLPAEVKKKLMWGAIIATILGAAIALIYSVMSEATAPKVLSFAVSGAVVVFGLAIIIGWLMIYVFLDLKIFQRKQDIEDVLPDFLQLTSANISAGMPIDKALWMAIRPQFGVLSKEIQEVAKATMAGESLEKALHTMTHKYQSTTLTRAVNLLLEGLNAGGEMADLLNKIAIDIQELKLMRKEMAADVMTYVLFITVATILVAPFLFGLATQLLAIVQSIIGNLNLGTESLGGGGLLSMNFSSETIKKSDFTLFCVSMLTVSSIFSSMIVSMIRKGNVKEGFKYIPISIATTVGLYFLATWALGKIFGGFF